MAGISLGKDVTVTGISNVTDVTIDELAAEYAVHKRGDTYTKIVKGWIDQTVEVSCNDTPGCVKGGTVTLTHASSGGFPLTGVKYLVTKVAKTEPLDGIVTFSVSLTRARQS